MPNKFEKIIQYNDPKYGKYLRGKTIEVKRIDNDVIYLLEDLKKLAKANSKDGIILVGLSAPQVGSSLSVFVFYDMKKEKYIEVINPKLIYSSKEFTSEWEGCASIGLGKSSLFGPVKRSRLCQVRFTNINGEDEVLSASNYQSHILQHELDHLEGILFLDRIEDPKMILTAKELDDYAKKNKGNYPKL